MVLKANPLKQINNPDIIHATFRIQIMTKEILREIYYSLYFAVSGTPTGYVPSTKLNSFVIEVMVGASAVFSGITLAYLWLMNAKTYHLLSILE